MIAERTARFTGADLEDLTCRAGLLALRESLETSQVQRAHFEQAARETQPSVIPEMVRTLKQEGPQRQPIGFLPRAECGHTQANGSGSVWKGSPRGFFEPGVPAR